MTRAPFFGGNVFYASINRPNEILNIERLAQYRLHDSRISFVDLTCRRSRDDDHTFGIWSLAGEEIQNLVAAHFGQHQIEDNRTVVVSLDLRQSLFTVSSFIDDVSFAVENSLHDPANGCVIIDDEN